MILSFIKKYPEIHSISNLVIHDYGLGHFVISMHIEGTDKNSLLELDYIAHEIAYHLYYELNCDSAIQVDILDVSEETTAIITTTVNKVLSAMEPPATPNNFRVVYAKDFLDISLKMCIRDRHISDSLKKLKDTLERHENAKPQEIKKPEPKEGKSDYQDKLKALNSSIAVSYTHLDVYKRQAIPGQGYRASLGRSLKHSTS